MEYGTTIRETVVGTDAPREARIMRLERLIWDPDMLSEYAVMVHTMMDRPALLGREFSDQQLEQIAEKGIWELGDEVLGRLLQSPDDLRELADRVGESASVGWLAALNRHAADIMDRRRITWVTSRNARANEKRSYSRQFEGRPGSGSQTETQRALAAFEKRRMFETDAVERIVKLPSSERDAAVQSLRNLLKKMRGARGRTFLDLDMQFHRELGRHSVNDPTDVDESIEFIRLHGPGTVDRLADRRVVCDEHEEIINALAAGDGNLSFESVLRHLRNSNNRWFPDLVAAIHRSNRGLFESLEQGGSLWFLSPNVVPVEVLPNHWESLGTAVAEAVWRGAQFVYFTWSETLIAEAIKHGINVNIREQGMRDAIMQFQVRIVEHLKSRDWDPLQVQDIVQERVVHILVDLLNPFARLNQTYGLFRTASGESILTHRDDLRGEFKNPGMPGYTDSSGEQTWLKIEPCFPSQSEIAQYWWTLRNMLDHTAQYSVEQGRVARRLLETYFGESQALTPTTA